MKPKILITGASGFIGSHLVDAAVGLGWDVWAGIRPTSDTRFLPLDKIHLLELDYSSPDVLVNKFLELNKSGGLDYVVHNAGITYAKRKADFHAVNCRYTENLVEALKISNRDLKKFVFISSLAAYGPGDAKTMRPIRSSDSQQPVSSYGESKRQAEVYLRSQSAFPFVIVNPTAVYGPRDKDFLEFVSLIKRGVEPYMGSYPQMISMVYVKDLAAAVMGLALSSASGHSYFVSDGHDYSKQQLGRVVKSVLNRKTVKLTIPLGGLRWTVLAVEKIYNLFGTLPFLNAEKLDEISRPNWLCDSTEVWKTLAQSPEYDLERGMKATIDWYIEKGWVQRS